MTDDILTESYPLYEEEEIGLGWMVAEPPYRELSALLEDLLSVKGSSFVSLLKEITSHNEFKPLDGENGIFITGGEKAEDYANLLCAARKAVGYGYRVFILPNPKNIRTADFIFERKGVYKMFDLKTISGKNSVGNRLKESVGQTKCVLLHIVCDYNVRNLAFEIKRYFEMSIDASEVMIFVGKKVISVKRNIATSKGFLKMLMRSYKK
jgi:hypothetical protein